MRSRPEIRRVRCDMVSISLMILGTSGSYKQPPSNTLVLLVSLVEPIPSTSNGCAHENDRDSRSHQHDDDVALAPKALVRLVVDDDLADDRVADLDRSRQWRFVDQQHRPQSCTESDVECRRWRRGVDRERRVLRRRSKHARGIVREAHERQLRTHAYASVVSIDEPSQAQARHNMRWLERRTHESVPSTASPIVNATIDTASGSLAGGTITCTYELRLCGSS